MRAARHSQLEAYERPEQPRGRGAIGTMHIAKRLGVKAVMHLACGDDLRQSYEHIEETAEKSERDKSQEAKRNQVDVGCGRARDRRFACSVRAASRY